MTVVCKQNIKFKFEVEFEFFSEFCYFRHFEQKEKQSKEGPK